MYLYDGLNFFFYKTSNCVFNNARGGTMRDAAPFSELNIVVRKFRANFPHLARSTPDFVSLIRILILFLIVFVNSPSSSSSSSTQLPTCTADMTSEKEVLYYSKHNHRGNDISTVSGHKFRVSTVTATGKVVLATVPPWYSVGKLESFHGLPCDLEPRDRATRSITGCDDLQLSLVPRQHARVFCKKHDYVLDFGMSACIQCSDMAASARED